MRVEEKYNPIKDFKMEELDDPDFGEDSVREEIIVPILKFLGYSASKPYRIVRSKSLSHPFVSLGSSRKKITSIPDYIFEVNDRYSWILEAKAPDENITSGAHVEQAYSYAIHSEIRVPMFALCNGREFVLFNISKPKPILHFSMHLLPQYLDELDRILGPENSLTYEFKLAKDLGLHLKRLGFHEVEHLVFPDVPINSIAQLDNEMFTTGSSTKLPNGDTYVVSLDFGLDALAQLKNKIPKNAMDILLERRSDGRSVVQFKNASLFVMVDCRVGDKLEENSDEIFMPLIVNGFF
ncbi:type I restriction enzyme HsdR N-terminal domain-containing protein [Pseudomonas cichorii]|uniref:type I restriction enzyme HsdR N-terminal domain-containing protein n=1 Tax=Pseudomonas cichorii TaxID=36746 RepID=UPI001C8A201B|nr:type I restriction enzyme HsdR N-terminal domain-containing protein [Pseudomonas cichorii]MBX8513902.1 type I restriction enzyme HsdR N-terminal domain-containing protein [Pseudomonas cichorii]MBX8576081.1 type I restriction enzyme HsdR N-terminal domain-containing protein [Pseudomonas cichorii]